MDIKRIAVIGAGTMGTGIAQVAATRGFEVVLNDLDQGFLDRSRKVMDKSLSKLQEKGRIEEDKDTVLGRIQCSPLLLSVT